MYFSPPFFKEEYGFSREVVRGVPRHLDFLSKNNFSAGRAFRFKSSPNVVSSEVEKLSAGCGLSTSIANANTKFCCDLCAVFLRVLCGSKYSQFNPSCKPDTCICFLLPDLRNLTPIKSAFILVNQLFIKNLIFLFCKLRVVFQNITRCVSGKL